VLCPPLAISKADLSRLVAIVRDSIAAAHASAYGAVAAEAPSPSLAQAA
jgi:hypothetical protein